MVALSLCQCYELKAQFIIFFQKLEKQIALVCKQLCVSHQTLDKKPMSNFQHSALLV